MINILNKINLPIFFFSFIFGLFMCYIIHPTPRIVIKYPTPEGDDIYIDDSQSCYKYVSEEIECPKDKNIIKEIPIQQTIFTN